MIRPTRPSDAKALLALRLDNRAYLEPWEPDAEPRDRRYTLGYSREWVRRPNRYVIVDGGVVAGALSLSDVAYEAFWSAMLGYWVAQAHAGRGLATRAVAEALQIAFGELGLHRVEAGTRVENVASQRVLERNGFTRVGVLRAHLLIGGEWRDHFLYEKLADDA